MSTFCPDGHRTESTDYCDVCGLPVAGTLLGGGGLGGGGLGGGGLGGGGLGGGGLGGGGASPSAPSPSHGPLTAPSPARDATKPCPHCRADAPAAALFCEDCGYDFTTGALPPPPVAPPATAGHAPTAPLLAGGESGTAPVPAAAAGAAVPAPGNGSGVEWVAEVWVDPDWYATQDTADPCPSAGMPVVVPLTMRSLLVGRRSVSRNITPQIDCGADSGVSRRHAQLTTDGQRWWIEDLQSSNGTYIGQAGGSLPTTSLPAGQRVELGPGDRVYVGAYTRIVIRRATPDEQ